MSSYHRFQALTQPTLPRTVPEGTSVDRRAVGHALIRLSRGRGFFRIPGTPNTARLFAEGCAVFTPNGELLSFTSYRDTWV